MAGYSGTPLVKKLGIKEGMHVRLVDAPQDYVARVAPLPEGVTFVARTASDIDFVHIFTTKEAHLAKALRAWLPRLKQDGMIWVSWPKLSAKVATDVREDTVRKVALPLGLVDVKVCAVDDVWSGLKLVIRRSQRTS